MNWQKAGKWRKYYAANVWLLQRLRQSLIPLPNRLFYSLNPINMKVSLLKCWMTGAIVASSSLLANAQCVNEQAKLDELQKLYQARFVDLEAQSKELEKLIPDSTGDTGFKTDGVNISGDITFKKQRYSFDVPEVTMRNKEMSMTVPQFTMKTKSFSLPYSKSEWKVTEVGFGIKTKTLVITNGTKKYSFKFPEVKMAVSKIVTKIPEIKMQRKDVILSIPEFKFQNPIPQEGPSDSLEKKAQVINQVADNINENGKKLETEQKEKIRPLIVGLFNCIETQLTAQIAKSQSEFSEANKELTASINTIVSNKMDPSKVVAEDGTQSDLLQVKADLEKNFYTTMDSLNAALRELRDQRDKILAELNTPAGNS